MFIVYIFEKKTSPSAKLGQWIYACFK